MSVQSAQLTSLMGLGILAAIVAGCVSSGTFELAKSNAENARLLYENEQRRSQELLAANKRLKLQVEELQTRLQSTRDQLQQKDKDWRETRDELLRLKIEREQQRARSRERPVEPLSRYEAETPALEPKAESPRRPALAAQEEARRQVRELMQQLEALLREF